MVDVVMHCSCKNYTHQGIYDFRVDTWLLLDNVKGWWFLARKGDIKSIELISNLFSCISIKDMFKPPSNVGIMICILIRWYIYLIIISIGVWFFFSRFTVRKEFQDSFLTRCPWILIVLFNSIFYLLIHQMNLLLKMLQSFLLVLNITIKYSFSITCRTCSILILSTIYI